MAMSPISNIRIELVLAPTYFPQDHLSLLRQRVEVFDATKLRQQLVQANIARGHFKFADDSIFALGADIIHMHPSADGAAIGAAVMADFHRIVSVIGGLSHGVVVNLGSAVVMPEVFLKALNLARNLGARVDSFSAADMDFIRHYRPRLNVIERPTRNSGCGFALTGHHEMMFPLLAAAIRSESDGPPGS
jgi:hypothetical protein